MYFAVILPYSQCNAPSFCKGAFLSEEDIVHGVALRTYDPSPFMESSKRVALRSFNHCDGFPNYFVSKYTLA